MIRRGYVYFVEFEVIERCFYSKVYGIYSIGYGILNGVFWCVFEMCNLL